jgi:hypothetical protein
MNDVEERKKLYSKYRDELYKRQLSNSENFDKAILSLSSAGLGFSLAFIKDLIPFSHATYVFVLIISWFAFALAIICTIVSFYLSQIGIDKQLNYAEQYYLEGKEDFLNKKNWPSKLTNYFNDFAGLIFIIAIILTIWFVSINILKGGAEMADKNETKIMRLQEAAEIPKMQKLHGIDKIEKGAPIPAMQPIPKPEISSQPDSGQNGSNQDSSSSDK